MTPDRLLRTALTVNVALSAPWGLVAVFGAPLLAEPLGVPVAGTQVVGAVAVLAAALFWHFRSRPSLRPAEGWIAAVGDGIFGLALLVVALAAPEVTTIGRWVVGLSGVLVLDLAVAEFVGVRRLARGHAAGATALDSL